MKRVLALSLSAALLLVLGCGYGSYETRLNATLKNLEYRQRLDQFLNPAASGKFKDMSIFLRPPKPLDQLKEPRITAAPGLFDLESSFSDLQAKAEAPRVTLHVLARRKVAKKAAPKTAVPPPAEAVERGAFNTDVMGVLSQNDLGSTEALSSPKLQEIKARNNTFKRLQLTSPSTGNEVRVFLYNDLRENYDVALIWEVPPTLKDSQTVASGLPLTLESFTAGTRAARAFESGGVDEVETGAPPEGPGGGASPF